MGLCFVPFRHLLWLDQRDPGYRLRKRAMALLHLIGTDPSRIKVFFIIATSTFHPSFLYTIANPRQHAEPESALWLPPIPETSECSCLPAAFETTIALSCQGRNGDWWTCERKKHCRNRRRARTLNTTINAHGKRRGICHEPSSNNGPPPSAPYASSWDAIPGTTSPQPSTLRAELYS